MYKSGKITIVMETEQGFNTEKGFYVFEDKRRAEKQAATLPRVELIPLLKQEYVIEILSCIIDAIQLEKENHEDEKENHEGVKTDPFLSMRHWKQDFIARLKVPVEIKKMLGYKE